MLTKTSDCEHVIVIEDTHEINLKKNNFTYLLAENSKIQMSELVSYSMRMRPDRIVIGELRSIETTPFIIAMTSGHSGSLSTIHAKGASEAIERVALLTQLYCTNLKINRNQAIEIACRAIDIVIHLENKKIVQIIKLTGSQNGKIFYEDLLKESFVQL